MLASRFHHWQLRWLERRIPPARQFALNHKNIFIFLSPFGACFLLLCGGLFVLGTNYQNNLILLLCFFLLSLFLTSLFASYLNFSRLRIRLGKTQHVFAGEECQLNLWLESDAGESAKGILSAHFWQQQNKQTIDLEEPQSSLTLSLPCPHRGPLTLPRVTLSNDYPLGLFHCWTHLAMDTDIIVYPMPLPSPTKLTAKEIANAEEGSHAASSISGSDEFDNLRDYHNGDPLNHVAWKQVAKGRGMVSKQFSANVNAEYWLSLPIDGSDSLERHLSQLCYQILTLEQQNVPYGLSLGHQQFSPSLGLEHKHQCLSALAGYPHPQKSGQQR